MMEASRGMQHSQNPREQDRMIHLENMMTAFLGKQCSLMESAQYNRGDNKSGKTMKGKATQTSFEADYTCNLSQPATEDGGRKGHQLGREAPKIAREHIDILEKAADRCVQKYLAGNSDGNR